MKYVYINRHICTDAGTCLQMVSFSHIHTHGYAHNNTYQSIILRENVHELLLFSFTPSFSFLLLDLKYLLIYFLRWDGLWCTTSYSSVFDCFFTEKELSCLLHSQCLYFWSFNIWEFISTNIINFQFNRNTTFYNASIRNNYCILPYSYHY